jgi:hypothetical protein
MTGRVDLAAVAAAVLEETPQGGYRVRPGASRMVVHEERCRLGHLQAVIVRTVAGMAVLYRPADDARTARDVWAEAWTWERETVNVTCHCRVNKPFRWADAIS